MIYLIGGAPRVGKSVIATTLAKRISVPLLSTDEVEATIQETLSLEERALLLPSQNFSGNPLENTHTPSERIKNQQISARFIEPEYERAIQTAIDEHRSVIIEGIHILPDHIPLLKERYGDTKITCLFLGSEDLPLIVQGILQNTGENNWLKDSPRAVIEQVAEFTAAFSAVIREQCLKMNIPYRARSFDFERDVEQIVSELSARTT